MDGTGYQGGSSGNDPSSSANDTGAPTGPSPGMSGMGGAPGGGFSFGNAPGGLAGIPGTSMLQQANGVPLLVGATPLQQQLSALAGLAGMPQQGQQQQHGMDNSGQMNAQQLLFNAQQQMNQGGMMQNANLQQLQQLQLAQQLFAGGMAAGQPLDASMLGGFGGLQQPQQQQVAMNPMQAQPQFNKPQAAPSQEPNAIEWAEPFAGKGKKDPPFPLKLHQILSNPEFQEFICWNPHGRSWRILKPPVFEQVVIPLYFRHAKYASFMRQVNGWGFKRIVSGNDHNSYYHELFVREAPQLCLKMKRIKKGEKVPREVPDPGHDDGTAGSGGDSAKGGAQESAKSGASEPPKPDAPAPVPGGQPFPGGMQAQLAGLQNLQGLQGHPGQLPPQLQGLLQQQQGSAFQAPAKEEAEKKVEAPTPQAGMMMQGMPSGGLGSVDSATLMKLQEALSAAQGAAGGGGDQNGGMAGGNNQLNFYASQLQGQNGAMLAQQLQAATQPSGGAAPTDGDQNEVAEI